MILTLHFNIYPCSCILISMQQSHYFIVALILSRAGVSCIHIYIFSRAPIMTDYAEMILFPDCILILMKQLWSISWDIPIPLWDPYIGVMIVLHRKRFDYLGDVNVVNDAFAFGAMFDSNLVILWQIKFCHLSVVFNHSFQNFNYIGQCLSIFFIISDNDTYMVR